MNRHSIIRACIVFGVGILSAGGSCMNANVPSESKSNSEQHPGPDGLPAKGLAGNSAASGDDFVVMRMKLLRIADDRRTCAFEKVLRIPLPEKTAKIQPMTGKDKPGSLALFEVRCQVESFSIRWLPENGKKLLRLLISTTTLLYGIRRSGDDPLQYYITYGGTAVDQLRAADEAELFRKSEDWVRAHFGGRFMEYLRGFPTDEATIAAHLRRIRRILPDEAKGR